MTPDISERAFEAAIECALLRHGPDACPGEVATVRESPPAFGDEPAPGGYHRRGADDYDRALCLIPADVVDFLLATQPREWEKLGQHHGADVKPRFLARISREIARRGALDVLRNGVKDSGCRFRLAYFRPASGLNEELQRLHAANLFAVVRQLRCTIIVTTLQKFPVIAEQIGELPGRRFAVIVDEAHSSQSGESTKSLKAVLAAGSLEDAEREEAGARTPEEEIDERVLDEIRSRGRLPNLSTFAFTATPKPRTLELFGRKRPGDGKFEPFHRYSMRQAIEEGFILDVLGSYSTYKAYWRLLKTIEDDPRYDRGKAEYLLKSFVELHPHAIREKVAICVEHFAARVASAIDGRAKAMIVTRSRLHAVRTRLALDAYLAEKGHPWQALVAFSGTVKDGGEAYTESGMNSAGQDRVIGERQTAAEFEKPDCRFLVVASKFQTGFDQPLLHTMYVDKKLGGVNAVQTLSRLNRTHPGKQGVMVLDFANEAEEIRKAFEPYYETTLLSEATDPNLLYEVQDQLLGFGVFAAGDVDAFARVCFDPRAAQDKLYAARYACACCCRGIALQHAFTIARGGRRSGGAGLSCIPCPPCASGSRQRRS